MNYELTQVFRQRGDPEFARMLQEIRLGICSPETERALLSRQHVEFEPTPAALPAQPTTAQSTRSKQPTPHITIKSIFTHPDEREALRQIQEAGGDVSEREGNIQEIEPTRLYSTNANVAQLNQQMLEKLEGKGKRYVARDEGKSPYVESLKHCPIEEDLRLKVHCLLNPLALRDIIA